MGRETRIEMGTRRAHCAARDLGAAGPHWNCGVHRPMLSSRRIALEGASSGDEVDDQNDYRHHQQNVDETAHCGGGDHAEEPQYEENDEDCPKHYSPPVSFRVFLHPAEEERRQGKLSVLERVNYAKRDWRTVMLWTI